jgi:hypothetical protein
MANVGQALRYSERRRPVGKVKDITLARTLLAGRFQRSREKDVV